MSAAVAPELRSVPRRPTPGYGRDPIAENVPGSALRLLLLRMLPAPSGTTVGLDADRAARGRSELGPDFWPAWTSIELRAGGSPVAALASADDERNLEDSNDC